MATKRVRESYQEVIVSKKLKSESDFKDDKIFSRDALTEEIHMCLEYDFVTKDFGISISKQLTDKHTYIKVSDIESYGILKHFPLALKVIEKYSSKRATKPIDIPFEAVEFDAGEAGVIICIKENSFQRGNIQIDLRKCIKRADGTLIYTKEGVRIAKEVAPLLHDTLRTYKQQINNAVAETQKLVTMAQVCLLIHEIDSLCKQDERQSYRQPRELNFVGCLTDDTTQESWSDIVAAYWSVAISIVSIADACSLAEKALTSLPGVDGLFYSATVLEDPRVNRLKTMVVEKRQLFEDHMYVACVQQLAE